MKFIKYLLTVCLTFILFSCKNDDNALATGQLTFNFTHNWDGTAVTNANFNNTLYTNANGEQLTIERLRYLISDITLHKSNGETIEVDGYQLVDVTNNTNMSFTTSIAIPIGSYSDISFTFGFDAEDNVDGAYTDLNSASWNVPNMPMLGSVGGYHYMQFEGKFLDNTSTQVGFQYHTIRAADGTQTPPVVTETSIETNLGAVTINGNTAVEIKMNIAEWFKNPNTWDLNVLNSMLMPNYNAQIMMNANGQNVFSLGSVTP